MTSTKVKQAHDEIWAERKLLRILTLEIGRYTEKETRYHIRLYSPFINEIKKEWLYFFESTEEVNQFLKELT